MFFHLLFIISFMNNASLINLTLDNLFASCGQYAVDMLCMKLPYQSHKRTAPLDLRISAENDFHGPFGMISIGFFVRNESVQCVAVKFMKGYGGERILMKTRNAMGKIQQRLEKSQRQHLIELFDSGNTLRFNDNIMVMELGIETFHDRLYKRIESYENDGQMMEVIRNLTVPINELHQVAIHMKINPKNYLYVSVGGGNGGQQTLKLKDFGSAKIISSADKNEQFLFENDALDAFTSFNMEYTGAEYYGQKQEISSKFDIWSLGMIIYEIHIEQLRSAEGKRQLTELSKGALLREVGNLYLGFVRNHTLKFFGFNKDEIFKRSDWIKRYKKAVNVVIKLWHKFPKTALLVTNLLHNEPERRLSARGILAYLNGNCLPVDDELLAIKSAKELHLFNTVTMGEFKRQLTKKLRMVRLKKLCQTGDEKVEEMMPKYRQMHAMVTSIIGEQQKRIDQQQQQPVQICENVEPR